MSYNLKKYDLVELTPHYINGQSVNYYLRVESIVSTDDDKEYSNYDVITGHGSSNSKVLIKAKIEFDSTLDKVNHQKFSNDFIDLLKREYKYNEKTKMLLCNPHAINKIDIDYQLKRCSEKINFYNKKKKFFINNRRRNYVIKDVLN